MPAVTRVGDNNTGHDACLPTALASGSPNVNVNGIPVGRVGDPYNPHGCPAHVPHVGNIASGAPHVFINRKAAGRIGDPVTCGGSVAVGSSNVFVGNGGGGSLTINGQSVSAQDFKCKCVGDVIQQSPLFTDVDEIILATPDICINMSNLASVEKNAQGWTYLSQMLKRWIANNARDSEIEGYSDNIFKIDIDWLCKFDRVNDAIVALKAYSLDVKSQSLLAKHLKEDNITDGTFTYSNNELLWDSQYVNFVEVRGYEQADNEEVSGLTAAMGNFTLRAIPIGSIRHLGGSSYEITITGLAIYADDRFQFAGQYNLRYWSKSQRKFSYDEEEDYIKLTNDSFKTFRKNYNRGEDFFIMSNVKVFNDFSPVVYQVVFD